MFQSLLVIIYLAFISLGLPDALLGAAWPSVYPAFGVPVSYAGMVSMIIAGGTVISSLLSQRLTRRLGPGLVTTLSVGLTAAALMGFSTANSFVWLLIWAVPYGLGAGSVDAALNNYVALHYESRHMSWLHCMWGVGASAGPYIMGWVLTRGLSWHMGYRTIGFLQMALTAVLVLSLPKWQRQSAARTPKGGRALSLKQVLRIPGAWQIFLAFFCYSAVEQTACLWAASYLTLRRNVDAQTAASFAGMFFLGITLGRAVSGFITFKLNDKQMIHLGEGILAAGILMLLLPLGQFGALAGLALIGLGCAPIYPCIIHSTPAIFGAERSQAIIGVQMACAYTGSALMPPFFGLLARRVGMGLFPFFLLACFLLMSALYEFLQRRVACAGDNGGMTKSV